jgi:phosphohistidine phosphatase SixA
MWTATSRVLLVHADTDGPDSDGTLNDFRPLTRRGWLQADDVAAELLRFDIGRLLSGPALGCRQTLIPLAHALALEVEPTPELGRDADEDALLRLLHSNAVRGSVMCTHVDLARRVLGRLRGASKSRARIFLDDASAWLISDQLGQNHSQVAHVAALPTTVQTRTATA